MESDIDNSIKENQMLLSDYLNTWDIKGVDKLILEKLDTKKFIIID